MRAAQGETMSAACGLCARAACTCSGRWPRRGCRTQRRRSAWIRSQHPPDRIADRFLDPLHAPACAKGPEADLVGELEVVHEMLLERGSRAFVEHHEDGFLIERE